MKYKGASVDKIREIAIKYGLDILPAEWQVDLREGRTDPDAIPGSGEDDHGALTEGMDPPEAPGRKRENE